METHAKSTVDYELANKPGKKAELQRLFGILDDRNRGQVTLPKILQSLRTMEMEINKEVLAKGLRECHVGESDPITKKVFTKLVYLGAFDARPNNQSYLKELSLKSPFGRKGTRGAHRKIGAAVWMNSFHRKKVMSEAEKRSFLKPSTVKHMDRVISQYPDIHQRMSIIRDYSKGELRRSISENIGAIRSRSPSKYFGNLAGMANQLLVKRRSKSCPRRRRKRRKSKKRRRLESMHSYFHTLTSSVGDVPYSYHKDHKSFAWEIGAPTQDWRELAKTREA